MSNIHDDVRTLETRVRELSAENRDLELENAQYRQRALDAETERDKWQEIAQRNARDATEASTILESLVGSFNSAMKRFRQNHVQQPSPDLQVRPRFLAQVQDDAERRGAEPPAQDQGGARTERMTHARPHVEESEGSRLLRTTHTDLPRPPIREPSTHEQLSRLANEVHPRTPPAVAPYVRPGSSRVETDRSATHGSPEKPGEFR